MKLTTMSQASVNAERLWANLYLSQALIKYSETQKKIALSTPETQPIFNVELGVVSDLLYQSIAALNDGSYEA